MIGGFGLLFFNHHIEINLNLKLFLAFIEVCYQTDNKP